MSPKGVRAAERVEPEVVTLAVAVLLQSGAYRRVARPDPDGTGVAYMGREIARFMSHEAADWLDRPERDAEERPRLLLRALAVKPGMTVADVGAGSGFLTFPLARLVGPRGKVFATDIQPEMLTIIRDRARARKTGNVATILGGEDDARLPPGSCDLILLVDVYHELSRPDAMARSMVRALKPGGRLALVEYRAEDADVPIKPLHKMSATQVRKELAALPLDPLPSVETLPRQHILLFRRR